MCLSALSALLYRNLRVHQPSIHITDIYKDCWQEGVWRCRLRNVCVGIFLSLSPHLFQDSNCWSCTHNCSECHYLGARSASLSQNKNFFSISPYYFVFEWLHKFCSACMVAFSAHVIFLTFFSCLCQWHFLWRTEICGGYKNALLSKSGPKTQSYHWDSNPGPLNPWLGHGASQYAT